jgi:hypothetical protein
MKDARTMTDVEYQEARAALIRQSREAPPAAPPAAVESTSTPVRPPTNEKPRTKLATEMTDEEYAAAKADLIRR